MQHTQGTYIRRQNWGLTIQGSKGHLPPTRLSLFASWINDTGAHRNKILFSIKCSSAHRASLLLALVHRTGFRAAPVQVYPRCSLELPVRWIRTVHCLLHRTQTTATRPSCTNAVLRTRPSYMPLSLNLYITTKIQDARKSTPALPAFDNNVLHSDSGTSVCV